MSTILYRAIAGSLDPLASSEQDRDQFFYSFVRPQDEPHAVTIFYSAVDNACDEQTTALKRSLSWDEVGLIEDTLFLEWLKSSRFDDLIDHALDEYDIQDGEAFCASLSEVLAKAGDRTRFERLFLGLAKTREAAFWRTWPKAQEGHIGAMKETARHLASALEAMAGLYHCYWVINDASSMESTKQDMLRLQARQKPARPKRGRTIL